MQQAVAYYRVSNARPGRLGIGAQKATVRRFAEAEGFRPQIRRVSYRCRSVPSTPGLGRDWRSAIDTKIRKEP